MAQCLGYVLFAAILAPLACSHSADPDADTTGVTSSTGAGATTGTASSAAPTEASASTDIDPGTSSSGAIETTDAGSSSGGDTDGPEFAAYEVMSLAEEEPNGLTGVNQWYTDIGVNCFDFVPPAECGAPPSLGEPMVLVDGLFADPASITVGSRVAVVFPYDDPECNLRCGSLIRAMEVVDGGSSNGVGWIPIDLPCSTAIGGVWLAFDFGVINTTTEHSTTVYLQDACETATPEVKFSFTPM